MNRQQKSKQNYPVGKEFIYQILLNQWIIVDKNMKLIPKNKQVRAVKGSKSFDTLIVFLKEFTKSLLWKKAADYNKTLKNYPTCKR